jgi:hypothetical protein
LLISKDRNRPPTHLCPAKAQGLDGRVLLTDERE